MIAFSACNSGSKFDTDGGTGCPQLTHHIVEGACVERGRGECESGRAEYCDDQCVRLDDPAYGCGRGDCEPCYANAEAECNDRGVCLFQGCSEGWGDCDNDLANGCETQLSGDDDYCGCVPRADLQNVASALCQPTSPSQSVWQIELCLPDFFDIDHDPANGCEVGKDDLCSTIDNTGLVSPHNAWWSGGECPEEVLFDSCWVEDNGEWGRARCFTCRYSPLDTERDGDTRWLSVINNNDLAGCAVSDDCQDPLTFVDGADCDEPGKVCIYSAREYADFRVECVDGKWETIPCSSYAAADGGLGECAQ